MIHVLCLYCFSFWWGIKPEVCVVENETLQQPFKLFYFFLLFCPCNDSFPQVIAMLVLISKRETMLRNMFGGSNSA